MCRRDPLDGADVRAPYGHGGPVEEPPQDVFLSDDPALSMVRAPMASWLAAHPCDCEGVCRCDDLEEPPVDANGWEFAR